MRIVVWVFVFAISVWGRSAWGALFNPSCSVGPGSSPPHQIYRASNAGAQTTSFTLTVSCISLLGIGATDVSISLDGGRSGNPAARYMLGPGGDRLNYNIYDSGGALVSNGATGLLRVTLTLLSLVIPVVHSFPLVLVIPAGQYKNTGSYTDSLAITVTYN